MTKWYLLTSGCRFIVDHGKNGEESNLNLEAQIWQIQQKPYFEEGKQEPKDVSDDGGKKEERHGWVLIGWHDHIVDLCMGLRSFIRVWNGLHHFASRLKIPILDCLHEASVLNHEKHSINIAPIISYLTVSQHPHSFYGSPFRLGCGAYLYNIMTGLILMVFRCPMSKIHYNKFYGWPLLHELKRERNTKWDEAGAWYTVSRGCVAAVPFYSMSREFGWSRANHNYVAGAVIAINIYRNDSLGFQLQDHLPVSSLRGLICREWCSSHVNVLWLEIT